MLPVRSLPDIRRRIRCKTSNLNYPGPRSAKKQDRQKTHTGFGLALGNDRPTAKSWAAHGQRVCGQLNDWGAQDYSESVSQSVSNRANTGLLHRLPGSPVFPQMHIHLSTAKSSASAVHSEPHLALSQVPSYNCPQSYSTAN